MPLPTYNCITDTSLLSVLRIGTSTMVADVGETLTLDCGKLVSGVEKKYNKIVGGVCAEMTAGEKTVVDDQEVLDEVSFLTPILYPMGEMEEISSNVALSLDSYVSECSGNIAVTLPDGTQPFQGKKILTVGGAALAVTATMKSPHTGFTLGANNRAEMVWSVLGGFWRVIEFKGLAFTP